LERSPLLEDNRAAGKGINHIRQAHYRVHNNQLLDATLSSSHQSVCVNPTYVSNTALTYAPSGRKCCLHLRVCDYYFVPISVPYMIPCDRL
jgi:hypothetical protein